MRLAGVLVVLSSVALAQSAQAQPASPDVVSLFKSLCWDKAGKIDQTLADAEAQHWTTLPKSMADQFQTGTGDVHDIQVRMTSSASGLAFLMVGQASTKGIEPGGVICGVGATGQMGGAQVAGQIASWLGAPAVDPDSKQADFVFIDGPQGRRFLKATGEPEKTAEWRTGQVKSIHVQFDPSATLVALLLPQR
jgi:hypothetical protein